MKISVKTILDMKPCEGRLDIFLKSLGKYTPETEVSIEHLLKHNRIHDTLWVLCRLPDDFFPDINQKRMLMCADFAHGRITVEELKVAKSAAWDSAKSASSAESSAWSAESAAWSAAKSAVESAVESAYSSAVESAAYYPSAKSAAALSAAKSAKSDIKNIILKYFGGESE